MRSAMVAGCRVRSRRGQTTNEYLMIAGLMTAMLIVLSGIVIPTLRFITVELALHMVVNLSSPARDPHAELPPCPEFAEPEENVECQ